MEQGRFLIVTGMSGAGKTQVLRTLEDLNYFCVDNLPAVLLPKFAELCRQTPNRNAAMVVDSRGDSFDKFVEMLEDMKDKLSPVTLEKREYPCGVRYNLIGDSSSVYNLKIDEDLVIL